MTFKNFILIFDGILVTLFSTIGILMSVGIINTQSLVETFSKLKSNTPLGPLIIISIFSTIVILNLVYLIMRIFFSRYASTIKVTQENSEVLYNIDCIEDAIASNILKLQEVEDAWVSIKVPKKASENSHTEIEIGFSVYEGYSVKNVSQKIKEIATLLLKHLIDYEKNLMFKIRLNKIVSKNISKKERKEKEVPPFRGPVYPIDDEIE
jgi:hypothetical protein